MLRADSGCPTAESCTKQRKARWKNSVASIVVDETHRFNEQISPVGGLIFGGWYRRSAGYWTPELLSFQGAVCERISRERLAARLEQGLKDQPSKRVVEAGSGQTLQTEWKSSFRTRYPGRAH
jgi:hypothetical protein